MKAMRIKRYTFDQPGAEESLEVDRDGDNFKATYADWLESPHNGSISDYKTREIKGEAVNNADTRILEKAQHDLRANFIRGMHELQERNWLEEIGIING